MANLLNLGEFPEQEATGHNAIFVSWYVLNHITLM